MDNDQTSLPVMDGEPMGVPAAADGHQYPEEPRLEPEFPQPRFVPAEQAAPAVPDALPIDLPEGDQWRPYPEGENPPVTYTDPRPEPQVLGTPPRLTSDPRGLPSERFKVADTLLDGADLPGLFVRGASLRGDEHRYFGTTRQDSLSICHVSHGQAKAYLACVADGVGSEPLSQYGSALVCELARDAVIARLSSLFTAEPTKGLRDLCQDLAAELAEQLTGEANVLDVPARALSTTLVAAVVEAEPADPARRQCAVFAVGDSPAFLLRAGEFHPLLADQHDTEITSTETRALPTAAGQVAVSRGDLIPGDMLLICTDGLSNPMRNPATMDQLVAWWGAGEVPSIPEFGWQLSFRVKSYGDDRTAICFWNR